MGYLIIHVGVTLPPRKVVHEDDLRRIGHSPSIKAGDALEGCGWEECLPMEHIAGRKDGGDQGD